MTDFLLDRLTGDLAFANGTIKTGDSDEQNQRLLLVCEKGSIKEFPDSCVGAVTYLDSEDDEGFLREIREQFTQDGMTVNKIVLEDNKVKVDANY